MKQSVIKFPQPMSANDPDKPARKIEWGKAPHHRGQVADGRDPDVYFKAAVRFLRDYPIGSRLSDADLDQWLEDHGFLRVPPAHTPKNSNEWSGHLHRRSQERKLLNRAAQHYRMFTEFDRETFIVSWVRGTDQYEVQSLHIAVFVNEWQQRADRHTATIKKQMQRLFQGVPWESFPPHVRSNLVRVYRELTYFQEDTAIRANRMNDLVQESYGEIESLIGGVALRQLLEGPDNDEEDAQ